MPQQNDLSRSLIPFDQATTLVAVIELSQSSWLIAGTVPGIDRQPLKKIAPDETELLRVLHRWRDEAIRKRADYHPYRCCLRGRARRVLAGTVADRAWDRGPYHPFEQRRGLARAQAGQDGSARHSHADAGVPGMVTRRTWPLRHGRDPDYRGRGCQAAKP